MTCDIPSLKRSGTHPSIVVQWQEDEALDEWLANINNTLADRLLPMGEAPCVHWFGASNNKRSQRTSAPLCDQILDLLSPSPRREVAVGRGDFKHTIHASAQCC